MAVPVRVARHVHVAFHIGVVVSVEFPCLIILADECLDDAVAFDVLLDHRVHRRGQMADGVGVGCHAAHDAAGRAWQARFAIGHEPAEVAGVVVAVRVDVHRGCPELLCAVDRRCPVVVGIGVGAGVTHPA